jgi:hypothetical protein
VRVEINLSRIELVRDSTPARAQYVLPRGGQLKKAVAKHNFHIKYEKYERTLIFTILTNSLRKQADILRILDLTNHIRIYISASKDTDAKS